MKQEIARVALVVRDYDEAIAFFTGKLRFTLVEDLYIPEQDKRWVVVAPPGASGATLVLARASTPEQESRVGNQSGGRVAFFLSTDDFWRDHAAMVEAGVTFVREPAVAPYGTVAVFEDLYGNLWDLVEWKRETNATGTRFPNVARWVQDGWIELGPADWTPSFIRVLDEGGLIWEGKAAYPSIDDALADAEQAIEAWLAGDILAP